MNRLVEEGVRVPTPRTLTDIIIFAIVLSYWTSLVVPLMLMEVRLRRGLRSTAAMGEVLGFFTVLTDLAMTHRG